MSFTKASKIITYLGKKMENDTPATLVSFLFTGTQYLVSSEEDSKEERINLALYSEIQSMIVLLQDRSWKTTADDSCSPPGSWEAERQGKSGMKLYPSTRFGSPPTASPANSTVINSLMYSSADEYISKIQSPF